MIRVKRPSITYEHDEVVFVPVFQENFDKDGTINSNPTFVYNLGDATHDEQMAWSMKPDYVMELRGRFKATTKDLIIPEEDDVVPVS